MEGTYEAPLNTCPYAIDYLKELKMSEAIKQSKKTLEVTPEEIKQLGKK